MSVEDQKQHHWNSWEDISCERKENWTTKEKKAFAIVKVFERMDHIFGGPSLVSTYNDHRNLLHVFPSLPIRPISLIYMLAKVHRCAIYMSPFGFVIERIQGTENVFADLLTRWSRGHRINSADCGSTAISHQSKISSSAGWEEVIIGEIKVAQESQLPPKNAARNCDKVWEKGCMVRIPSEADTLKQKILVTDLYKGSGHCQRHATENIIGSEFIWDNLTMDVVVFVQICIYCIITKSAERIPQPLTTALQRRRSNEVEPMNFLCIGSPDSDDLKYVLGLRDGLTSYSSLMPHNQP